ncbi:hypothetical protein CRENBAI_022225, partial [Crenichthys baileyi]
PLLVIPAGTLGKKCLLPLPFICPPLHLTPPPVAADVPRSVAYHLLPPSAPSHPPSTQSHPSTPSRAILPIQPTQTTTKR